MFSKLSYFGGAVTAAAVLSVGGLSAPAYAVVSFDQNVSSNVIFGSG